MFSFLHAADLHLDTPFEGLSVVDAALAARLRDASLTALDALVETALARRVDLVVLAGDLYDGAERGVRAQLRLRAGLQRLSEAGIYTFLAHGNHDPVEEGWSALRGQWPERVHVFAADRADVVSIVVGGQRVVVYGTSYPRRQQAESLVPRFPKAEGEGFHLAVLHANVGAASGHAAYSPCTVEELAALGMDYWALGHVHRAAVLREQRPRVVYPGNLQGRSFKPSERGPKGCVLVTIDGERLRAEAIDLAPVRFEQVEVDVAGLDDLAAVQERLAALVAPVAGRVVLVRAELTGRGEVARDLLRQGAVDGLLEELRQSSPDGVRWMELRDRTAAPFDLAALRERDDLGAAVVGASDGLSDLRGVLASHKALREVLAEVDDETLRGWLTKATALALDLLHPEETR
jgi:exonuclease SbcD